jgi:hypothetical protein
LPPHPARKALRDEYRGDVENFLVERCLKAQSLRVRADALYDAYMRWFARAMTSSTPSPNGFGRSLSALGITRRKSAGVIVYIGVALAKTAPPGQRASKKTIKGRKQ